MWLEALLLFKIEQPEDQEIEFAVKYSCCNQSLYCWPQGILHLLQAESSRQIVTERRFEIASFKKYILAIFVLMNLEWCSSKLSTLQIN